MNFIYLYVSYVGGNELRESYGARISRILSQNINSCILEIARLAIHLQNRIILIFILAEQYAGQAAILRPLGSRNFLFKLNCLGLPPFIIGKARQKENVPFLGPNGLAAPGGVLGVQFKLYSPHTIPI